MKKLLILSITLVLILMTSCSGKERAITQSTIAFLDAYFKTDYALAGTFCTQSMATELKEMLKSVESLDPVVKQMLIAQSKEIKTEILSVEKFKGSDSARVDYRVIMPKGSTPLEKSLSLVRENKEWRIAGLGK